MCLYRYVSIYIDVAKSKKLINILGMKISEIQSGHEEDFNAKITSMHTTRAKAYVMLLAKDKNKDLSEVMRDIVDIFIKHNSDELKSLEDKHPGFMRQFLGA